MASPRKPPTACSSRLPQLFGDYQQKLEEIDALERKFENVVSEKRQRALNILDETPTHRKSHLRLFVTHRHQEEEYLLSPQPSSMSYSSMTPMTIGAAATMTTTLNVNTVGSEIKRKKRNKWTLVIEGRLLVGHLDHERANSIEKEAAGVEKVNGVHSQSDVKGEGVDLSTNLAPRSTDRQANRTIYDREGEEPIVPIKFTHFFDRISVSFQSFLKKKDEKANTNLAVSEEACSQSVSVSNGQLGRSKRLPRRDSSGTSTKHVRPPKENTYETDKAVTKLIWDREPRRDKNSAALRTQDSHAFYAVYDEEQERPGEERSVVATIRLHRRRGGEQKYLPSAELCKYLFPSFLAEVRKRAQDSRRNEQNNASKNNSLSPIHSEGAHISSKAPDSTPIYEVPPLDNSTRVPNLFTLDDVVDAIFIYSKDRDLIDTKNLSIIQNDSVLQRLFDCKEMSISVMKRLILSRRLLQPINPENSEHDAAIECTYVMMRDRAHSTSRGTSSEKITSELAVVAPADNRATILPLEPVAKKMRYLEKKEDGNKEHIPEAPLHNLLSCDIDMDVPSLLHFRTRDILRRIKVREYEYTSSRTKAIRTVQSTGADEDVVRERLDDIVKGRALTLGHAQVLLALAKSAPPGSEARKEAHIDARTAMLLDRLEHHSKMAEAYWEIVKVCQGNLP